MNGKGSKPRAVDGVRFRSEHDRIFSKPPETTTGGTPAVLPEGPNDQKTKSLKDHDFSDTPGGFAS